MTKITIERETLQAALDALDACTTEEGPDQHNLNRARDTLTALRAALAAQPADPVAWINRRVIYDPATDSVTGYGEPELSFERASYGYDYANAKPLVLAQPAPAAVPPGWRIHYRRVK